MKKTLDRLSSKTRHLAKSARQSVGAKPVSQSLLFIVGCQRSGTTMMQEVLERDWSAKVFGEFSELSAGDPNGIRLDPLADVGRVIARVRAPFVVVRPLVESQRILDLLDYFETSRALWIFRDHRDVVASNLVKFGKENGINDLRPIIEENESNWRSEVVSERARELVERYFSPDMNPYDAAALFWFVRNDLYCHLNLETNERVFLSKYEDMVTDPAGALRRIYDFCSRKFPGESLTRDVHASSVGKGRDVEISPEIDEQCGELYRQLETCYEHQCDKLRP